jgi:superfamily II DNA or RNA helicase
VTPYHSQYFACELTRKCSSSEREKLNASILSASVKLNPHQIDAALFAFRSPLSRGAILADEVGLGKTIEAGLIMSQLWAEHKRRILCIAPASIRQQWMLELARKFYIDSILLESQNFRQLQEAGNGNPFEQSNTVVICSYQFARSRIEFLKTVAWDLVVIDEAHRLRNIYRRDSKIAKAIHDAVFNRPKVLLTATPLQNSLMELWGLVSFIDPHVFGNADSFRIQFAQKASAFSEDDFRGLRRRIEPVCQRTLRRQVREYVSYTQRISITQDFTPTDDEIRLYELVSEYLQRPDSLALPKSQRSLITLVLRKILASSSFAIADTIGGMAARLESDLHEIGKTDGTTTVDQIAPDYESGSEVQEEWSESETEAYPSPGEREERAAEPLKDALQSEIAELRSYQDLAARIVTNAKGEALLTALEKGFIKLAELSARRKALIFTESRRTQRYLCDLLKKNGYDGQLVLLNGVNNDPDTLRIYRDWLKRHEGDQEIVSGRKSADIRSALVEEFQDRASIMIATESGAEGLNFQFCSLVVNYDLPWNPQRIEQRIGRCHRYGQEFDVVVINFINRRNAADQRVFELLSEKLKLFEGVFGTSDEILGALESGVDFEKRIHAIYQTCRTIDQINEAFDCLQADLDETIRVRLADARSKLFENFDEDVQRKLKLHDTEIRNQRSIAEEWLWRLTRAELGGCAEFHPGYRFTLHSLPRGMSAGTAVPGIYRLITQEEVDGEHHYRLNHPLAEHLLATAKTRSLASREIIFDYSGYEGKITVIDNLRGKTGWLRLCVLSMAAQIENEERIIFSGINEDGSSLDPDICLKLFSVDGLTGEPVSVADAASARLSAITHERTATITAEVSERNNAFFEWEVEKIDTWAEDLRDQLEIELKELDKEIRGLKKEARRTPGLDEKVDLHKKAKELERKRTDRRKSLFEAQDEIDRKKDDLIRDIERRLHQTTRVDEVFTIKWRVA